MSFGQQPYENRESAQLVYKNISFIFDKYHFKILRLREYPQNFGNWEMELGLSNCAFILFQDRGCIEADFAFIQNAQKRDHAISIHTLAQYFGVKNILVGYDECNSEHQLKLIALFLERFLPKILRLFSKEIYSSVRQEMIKRKRIFLIRNLNNME